jgi:phage-related protein (TIGR01555 family)
MGIVGNFAAKAVKTVMRYDGVRNMAKTLMRSDGWQNIVTGIGRARDKQSANQISPARIQMSRDLFDEYYHSDHTAAKIALLPAQEMVREWITLKVDDSVETGGDLKKEASTSDKLITAKQVMQALDDVGAKTALIEGLLWSRVHGGALIFLGVNDGEEDLSQPLDTASVKSFDYLKVYDRWDVTIEDVVTEFPHKDFGKPQTYWLEPHAESGVASATPRVLVHASRFIRIDGAPTSNWRKRRNGGWSDSVYTSMETTLSSYGISWQSVTHLLSDFSQAVLKMQGLAEALSEQDDATVINRLLAMDMCRSVARAIPIDAEGEDFMRAQTPMSGLAEAIDRLMLRVASAANMPATLLFGQSPAGLNATGESDIRFFYDQIKASQEFKLRDPIDIIIELLFAAKEGPTKGIEPANWSYEFNPLWQETDSQRATTRKTQAETDDIYIGNGTLDPDEVAQSRFGGDAYSTDTVLDTERRAASVGSPDDDGGDLSPGQTDAIESTQALNGAQVQALVGVIQEVNAGTLSADAAAEIIKSAFPIPEDVIQRMLKAKPKITPVVE